MIHLNTFFSSQYQRMPIGQRLVRSRLVRTTVLLALLLSCVIGSASWLTQAADISPTGITLTHTLTWPADVRGTQSIDLLSLSEGDGTNAALTATWKLVQSGWFSNWHVFLQSDTGLIPPELMGQSGQGIQVGPLTPLPGRTYEAELSFDYGSGVLALALYDPTELRYLYQGEWRIHAYTGQLYPTELDSNTTVVSPEYRPVAARWDAVIQGQSGGLIAVRLLERTEPAWIRVESAPTGSGELRAVIQGRDDTMSIAITPENGRYAPLQLPLAQLPAGPIAMKLQLWQDSEIVWESKEKTLTVGRVAAAIEQATIDTASRTLELAVSLMSDGPLADIDLALDVQLVPLHWDSQLRGFSDGEPAQRMDVKLAPSGKATTASVAVQIPLPQDDGMSRIRLNLKADPAVLTDLAQRNLLFSPASETVIVTAGDPQAITGSALRPTNANWLTEVQAIHERYADVSPGDQNIVFIGSSSIRGWRSLPQDYPSLSVLNSGFGGSQIIDSVLYADELVIRYAPGSVFLYAGSNDISAGKSPTQVFADYVAFVDRIHASLPETRIFFISIAPSPSRWAQRFNVMQANRLIELYTETDDRLEYIDVYSHMLGPDGTPQPDLYISDQLHMTPKGYALWREIVRPYLGLED